MTNSNLVGSSTVIDRLPATGREEGETLSAAAEPFVVCSLAHRVNSRQCSTWVAFGANRTLTEPRLQKADL
jgi:hypothetical protein